MASTSMQLRGLGLSCKPSTGVRSLSGGQASIAKGSSRVELGCLVLKSSEFWRGNESTKANWIVSGRRRSRSLTSKAVEESFDASNVAVEDEQQQELSPEDEQDQRDIAEVLGIIELLRKKRDMTFNEVRLTVMIEDPREVERRRQLGIEDDRGCSREDLGNALLDVYEGRIPQDRIVLRELTKEMLNWPNLEEEIAQSRTPPTASPYAKVTNTGVDPRIAAERAKIDWDTAADITPGEGKKDLGESLPPVVGYSFLYLVSFIPFIIGIAVVLILFLNSLQ
ncbi:hypothetical protein R1sor_018774 [Riccia sorocarpa]|uniref:Protein CHLOROPLAST ENHANCING STRESS TOLERANCE, chloroplastic n=1 Tax=Riccia sorocarpa TaxID=122646 RepID=A0ABD3IEU4_9MARC